MSDTLADLEATLAPDINDPYTQQVMLYAQMYEESPAAVIAQLCMQQEETLRQVMEIRDTLAPILTAVGNFVADPEAALAKLPEIPEPYATMIAALLPQILAARG